MHQAAILSSEKNYVDGCLAGMLEILNVQDFQSANLIMDSLSRIHSDKVRLETIKADTMSESEYTKGEDTFYTEDQKQFLSLFKGCFKSKAEYGAKPTATDLTSKSLQYVPQHLLFTAYLLRCLRARENKTKLLYTLNTFRAIQRRLALELREMGTRDRVLGDVNFVRPMERTGASSGANKDGDAKNQVGSNADSSGLSG